MANFSIAQEITSEFEGGYFNDPTGGPTYSGIAKKFHPDWPGFDRLDELQQKLYPGRQIPRYTVFDDDILTRQVNDFYAKFFWPLTLGNQIENQVVANMIYDFFVHKANDAIRVINNCANIFSPGVSTFQTKLSPHVVKTINDMPVQFYATLRNARINYYKTKKGFSNKSRKNFIQRVNKLPQQLATAAKKAPQYVLFSGFKFW